VKKKKPSLAETVSRNIRKARLEAGMTQKELADKAGFKVSYIGRLETNPQNLCLSVVHSLARAMEIQSHELLINAGGSVNGCRLDLWEIDQIFDLLKKLTNVLNRLNK
jgi:ribosome-binding protein aMBF1 (putative translation factor)